MTYEEYLVEFNNRAQMAYNNFRVSMGRGGYQGKHFDPNYRGCYHYDLFLNILIIVIIIIS